MIPVIKENKDMAAVSEELINFIREALQKGLARTEIEKVLLEAGWMQEEVAHGLGKFADVDFPIPVPRPKPYLSAMEAFLYLLLFAALYMSAYNLGSLLFNIIALVLPDPALTGGMDMEEWIERSIRWDISMLLIAFPLYLYMSYLISRSYRRDPLGRGSKIRKWLTYVTLFIVSGFIVGDLAVLVFNLLGGEMTLRFFLKFLVVAVIAGTIFGYYLWDLRKEEKEK
ncbi:DUF5671 domain-containing protein [Sulfurimonas sp. HSL-1656]|uniref:DUF5671 domain-containing protein n=1 Tax=Thiomicrolovo subterrani TaxID=3131934 RepID=UPI0031F76634